MWIDITMCMISFYDVKQKISNIYGIVIISGKRYPLPCETIFWNPFFLKYSLYIINENIYIFLSKDEKKEKRGKEWSHGDSNTGLNPASNEKEEKNGTVIE